MRGWGNPVCQSQLSKLCLLHWNSTHNLDATTPPRSTGVADDGDPPWAELYVGGASGHLLHQL